MPTAPTTETEPNNTASQANYMEYGDSLDAAINPLGDIDYYKFMGLAGDTVEVFGHDRNGSGLGGAPMIFAGNGNTVYEFVMWGGTDQRLVAHLPSTGTYYIRYAHEMNWGGFPNGSMMANIGTSGRMIGIRSATDATGVKGVAGWRPMQTPAKQKKISSLDSRSVPTLLDYDYGDYGIRLRKFVPRAPEVQYAYSFAQFFDHIKLQFSALTNGLPTVFSIEYGPTTSYGSSVVVNSNPVSSLSVTSFDQVTLDGLAASSTYHLRIVGSNSGGTVHGEDYVVDTPAPPEGISAQESGTSYYLYAVSAHGTGCVTAAGESGTILHTSNGGIDWTNQAQFYGPGFYAISFPDSAHGYVAGESGMIYRTSDDGNTWNYINSGSSEWLLAMSFATVNTGMVVGANGVILRTTDAGSSWVAQSSGTTQWLKSIVALTPETAVAVGDAGTVLRTTDGGVNWVPQSSGTTSDLYALQFVDALTGFVATISGTVLKTTDGGVTWTTSLASSSVPFFGGAFSDPMNGLAVGSGGGIVRTGTGGTVWQKQNSGTTSELRAASFADVSTGYIVGQGGVILCTHTFERQASVLTQKGWNIISLPLTVSDSSVSALFPHAISSAFAFNGLYTPASSLQTSHGYWLKFDSIRTTPILGKARTQATIQVTPGWNLIGGFDLPCAVNSVTTEPNGIIASHFFAYSGGYVHTSTLQVGQGYWVKTSQSGVLHLVASQFKTSRAAEEATSLWLSIEITDTSNTSTALYLAPSGEIDSSKVEMPPPPPMGIRDIRFGSNASVEQLEQPAHRIVLSSVTYPIRITARNTQGRPLRLRDCVGGTLLDVALTEGETIVLDRSIGNLLLEDLLGVAGVPTTFSLSQNYPNPFNPTTVIQFGIPRASHVQLSVFNVLGQRLADLVDEIRQAGYYEVKFNASRYASGTYFYSLDAGGHTAVKKMVILK